MAPNNCQESSRVDVAVDAGHAWNRGPVSLGGVVHVVLEAEDSDI